MNRIEISVLKPEAALRTFARIWHAAETDQEMAPKLAFGSLRELFSAITEKRLELLRHVAIHEGLNVRQLAKSRERDYKNVHTDVTSLVKLGPSRGWASGRLACLHEVFLWLPSLHRFPPKESP